MMYPEPIHDDSGAAQRAQERRAQERAAQFQNLPAAVRKLERERDELTFHLCKMRAELASTQDDLRKAKVDSWCDVCCGKGDLGTGSQCICGGTGQAASAVTNLRSMLVGYRTLAEAVRALAESQQWKVIPGYQLGLEILLADGYTRNSCLPIAKALLALGPEWDWRGGENR